MSSKIVFKVAKNLLFLLAGIFMLYLAFRGNDLEQLLEDIRAAEYFYVILSMFFGIAAFYFRAFRWIILLEPLGYKARVSTSVYSIIIGYLANLAIPRIGEITRCTAMSKAEKIPVDKLFGTVILERVIDLLLLILFTVFTVLTKVDAFGGFFYNLIAEKASGIENINQILIILGLAFLGGIVFLYLFRQKYALHPFAVKVRSFLRGLGEGLVSIGKIKKKRWFIFHTLGIWAMYYLMTWVVFYAIEETSVLGMVDGLFILVVGGFGMAAPVQGGIGAYHLIVSMGMGVLGVAQTTGLSYATIVHTSQTLLVLFLGVISLILIYFAGKNPANKEEKV